jgi:hypothetical protein
MMGEEIFNPSEIDVFDDEPDFAEEHARITTTDVAAAGKDTGGDDPPRGLGGMDLKRRELLL